MCLDPICVSACLFVCLFVSVSVCLPVCRHVPVSLSLSRVRGRVLSCLLVGFFHFLFFFHFFLLVHFVSLIVSLSVFLSVSVCSCFRCEHIFPFFLFNSLPIPSFLSSYLFFSFSILDRTLCIYYVLLLSRFLPFLGGDTIRFMDVKTQQPSLPSSLGSWFSYAIFCLCLSSLN